MSHFGVPLDSLTILDMDPPSAANAEWAANPSDALLEVIAMKAGMDLEGPRTSIATMSFPTVEGQMVDGWLGANAATFMKGVADVFVEAGSIYFCFGQQ